VARAVSTVLDVAVCLLLVGAAVATLGAGPYPADRSADPAVDATAATVATVTTSVDVDADRRAHGTLAEHLAAAAVADARLDDDPVVESRYPARVADEADALAGRRVYVTARWAPYPEAPLAGSVAAGERPPPDADVAARTLTVESGVAAPGSIGSFESLARALADAYVPWRFPPERTYAGLADARTADRTRDRYGSAAETLDADLGGHVADREVRAANEILASALAARLEADLRDRYATPRAAAADVAVDEVELVVRRWDP
jgi:hypothetical protein